MHTSVRHNTITRPQYVSHIAAKALRHPGMQDDQVLGMLPSQPASCQSETCLKHTRLMESSRNHVYSILIAKSSVRFEIGPEHGSILVVRYTNEMGVMDEVNFAKFYFQLSFGRTS